MQRSYTVSEIQRMRQAIRECMLAEEWKVVGWKRYEPEALFRSAEEYLRTYIIAGVAPEELEAEATALKASAYGRTDTKMT